MKQYPAAVFMLERSSTLAQLHTLHQNFTTTFAPDYTATTIESPAGNLALRIARTDHADMDMRETSRLTRWLSGRLVRIKAGIEI